METTQEKYRCIKEITENDNNLLNITWLCEIAGVSRSGYYSWFNNKNSNMKREKQDQENFNLILEAYMYRGYNKGARSIYMRLLHKGIVMNLKKIRRLMKKYGLKCPIRTANPYRRMAKALKTDSIAKNEVNRNFRQEPRKVILTDITYLFYGTGKKAYLSCMKDGYTKQILAYVVSGSLEIDFVLETVKQLISRHGKEISMVKTEVYLHSDQGCHYTSIQFRQLLKDKNLRQSMSRKGNCWDNAPQESFFGHMKDEIDIRNCNTLEELKAIIDDYMDYYNNERYQWELAKLSPNEYYEYCVNGIYPLSKYGTEA